MERTFWKSARAVGVFSLAVSLSNAQAISDAITGQSVMQVEEQFRVAKLKNDTAALDRILADNFYEMNQNGNGRNKAEFIELFKTFPISSLTTDSYQVRVNGDTVSVTGTQTESGGVQMLFLRVYVKGSSGWQLLSSLQADNPKVSRRNSELATISPSISLTNAEARLRLEMKIATLKLERSRLLETLTAESPKFVLLDKELRSLENLLASGPR